MQATTPKVVFIAAIGVALAAAVAAVMANMSESNFVMLSYLLVPLFVFGATGLSVAKGHFKSACVYALIAVASLFCFMVLIFPRL